MQRWSLVTKTPTPDPSTPTHNSTTNSRVSLTGHLFSAVVVQLFSCTLGPASAMRRRTSSCLDFTGDGYIVCSTLKPKSAKFEDPYEQVQQYKKKEGDFYYVAVLPVKPFLAVLDDPREFANILEKKAKEVLAEWIEKNKGVEMPRRLLTERQFILHSFDFRNAQGGFEHTQIEMQLSSYGYTLAANRVAQLQPPLLRDLKASSKNFV